MLHHGFALHKRDGAKPVGPAILSYEGKVTINEPFSRSSQIDIAYFEDKNLSLASGLAE